MRVRRRLDDIGELAAQGGDDLDRSRRGTQHDGDDGSHRHDATADGDDRDHDASAVVDHRLRGGRREVAHAPPG
jgi:hypothetical protein